MKKNEIECKGKVYIGFDFCEGGVNMKEERGVFANRRGEVSVPLLATWPAMGERENEIFVVEISWWKLVEEKGILGFWKIGKARLVEEGKK